MKHYITTVCLIASCALGQSTYEPYVLIQDNPAPSTSNVWVMAWSDRPTHPEGSTNLVIDTKAKSYWYWFFERGGKLPSQSLPVLVDMADFREVRVTGTVDQAIADLANVPHSYGKQAEQLKALAPLLDDHPAAYEIPEGGLYYRLSGTNSVTTLWFVRSIDSIATQLSAHDDAGDDIVHSINLKTGIERTINLVKMSNAKQFKDLSDATNVRTNKIKKASSN